MIVWLCSWARLSRNGLVYVRPIWYWMGLPRRRACTVPFITTHGSAGMSRSLSTWSLFPLGRTFQTKSFKIEHFVILFRFQSEWDSYRPMNWKARVSACHAHNSQGQKWNTPSQKECSQNVGKPKAIPDLRWVWNLGICFQFPLLLSQIISLDFSPFLISANGSQMYCLPQHLDAFWASHFETSFILDFFKKNGLFLAQQI